VNLKLYEEYLNRYKKYTTGITQDYAQVVHDYINFVDEVKSGRWTLSTTDLQELDRNTPSNADTSNVVEEGEEI